MDEIVNKPKYVEIIDILKNSIGEGRGHLVRVEGEIKRSILKICSCLCLHLYRLVSDQNVGMVRHEQQGAIERDRLFKAWVNNRMALLLIHIERCKDLSEKQIMQIDFFLENVMHHFVCSNSGRRTWNAFKYLKLYFRSETREKHSKKAVQMVRRIYSALGIECTYHLSNRRIFKVKDILEAASCCNPI